MAHLAFVCPPFLGHLNPMRALARALVARGHRATFIGIADAAEPVADGGIGFQAVGLDTHPPGALAAITGRMAAIDGPFGLRGVLRDVVAATAMLVRDLPGALRGIGADMLVCDGTEAAGGLVAAHLGIPMVTVANALPLNREPAVPPPFVGWRYDPSSWGTERNRGGYRVSDWLMRPHGEIISDAAARWGLGKARTIADCLSPLAQISQTVAGLDFPRAELPSHFHHVGPLRDPREPGRPAFGLPPKDGRPLAYASLGTLQGGRAGLFHRIAEGAERAGIRLIIAHGGRLSEGEARALPGKPAAYAFVPQAEVLAASDLAILNGGLNTVMDALAQGRPILCLPIAFEQAAIASRIGRAGAGRRVWRRFLGPGRLAREIRLLIDDPSYREAAARLAAEIAEAGGVERAADIVEAAYATGRPVTREDVGQRQTRLPACGERSSDRGGGSPHEGASTLAHLRRRPLILPAKAGIATASLRQLEVTPQAGTRGEAS